MRARRPALSQQTPTDLRLTLTHGRASLPSHSGEFIDRVATCRSVNRWGMRARESELGTRRQRAVAIRWRSEPVSLHARQVSCDALQSRKVALAAALEGKAVAGLDLPRVKPR
jgi:hypothetical protein